MNIRLLKKLRKRYKYYFVEIGLGDYRVAVMDTKNKRFEEYKLITDFIGNWTFAHLSIAAGTRYYKRICRRKQAVEYYKHLRHVSPQIQQP